MPVNVELNNLIEYAANVRQTITEGLKEGAESIHDLARQLAPEDSGELKNSGKVEVIDDFTVEVSFGNDLNDDRAAAQEYGTVYMPAQPFLTPAAKEIDVKQIIINHMDRLK